MLGGCNGEVDNGDDSMTVITYKDHYGIVIGEGRDPKWNSDLVGELCRQLHYAKSLFFYP